MSKIKDVLQNSNPWWKEEFTVEFKDRDIYERIKKFLPPPQMIALTVLEEDWENNSDAQDHRGLHKKRF